MSRRNENIFEEKSHLGRKIGVTLLVVLLLTFGAGAVANFAISNTVKTLRQTVTIPDLPNSLDQWSILLLTDLNGGVPRAESGVDWQSGRHARSLLRHHDGQYDW